MKKYRFSLVFEKYFFSLENRSVESNLLISFFCMDSLVSERDFFISSPGTSICYIKSILSCCGWWTIETYRGTCAVVSNSLPMLLWNKLRGDGSSERLQRVFRNFCCFDINSIDFRLKIVGRFCNFTLGLDLRSRKSENSLRNGTWPLITCKWTWYLWPKNSLHKQSRERIFFDAHSIRVMNEWMNEKIIFRTKRRYLKFFNEMWFIAFKLQLWNVEEIKILPTVCEFSNVKSFTINQTMSSNFFEVSKSVFWHTSYWPSPIVVCASQSQFSVILVHI